MTAVEFLFHLRIIEYPKLEGTHKGHQVLAPHSTTKESDHMSWELCPDASWIPAAWCHNLCPGQAVPGPEHPLVQNRSLTPSCPSPDTAPCRSLGPCRCHTEQSSALPLGSLWGAAAAVRPPLSSSALDSAHPRTQPLSSMCCLLHCSPSSQPSFRQLLSNSFKSWYCGGQTARSARGGAARCGAEQNSPFPHHTQVMHSPGLSYFLP